MTPRFVITYFIDLCSLSLEDLLPGEGRWVVITGGNRGIGFEAVQMFLEHGYKVIIGRSSVMMQGCLGRK